MLTHELFIQLKKYFQLPLYINLLFATLKNVCRCLLVQQHGNNISCRFKKYSSKGNSHLVSIQNQNHRPNSLMEDPNCSLMHQTHEV